MKSIITTCAIAVLLGMSVQASAMPVSQAGPVEQGYFWNSFKPEIPKGDCSYKWNCKKV